MYKNDLIDAIAAESKLTKVDSKKALEAFVKVVTGALKSGDKIVLVGFGSFSVAKREARTGRNPQTGQSMEIKAKNFCKFKAGRELTDTVN